MSLLHLTLLTAAHSQPKNVPVHQKHQINFSLLTKLTTNLCNSFDYLIWPFKQNLNIQSSLKSALEVISFFHCFRYNFHFNSQ